MLPLDDGGRHSAMKSVGITASTVAVFYRQSGHVSVGGVESSFLHL